jgi:hypothetical protein
MTNGNSLKRKLNKKIIKKYGIDTVLLRFDSANVELDGYGEPISPSGAVFKQIPVRIVVDQDRRINEETELGGLPSSKEFMYFYVAGDVDIKTSDKLIYPPNTENEWLVYRLELNPYRGVNVITEVRASRDKRY